MKDKIRIINFSGNQLIFLIILRVLIGWNFLYEGLAKLLTPGWTAQGFLLDSQGIFAGLFHSLANNDSLLNIVNFLNIWGLILIGSGLILGLLTRIATIAGIVLLAFYYLSHPPLLSTSYSLPSEGNYFLIDKNLIELFSLAVLLTFPTQRIIGIDRLIRKLFYKINE